MKRFPLPWRRAALPLALAGALVVLGASAVADTLPSAPAQLAPVPPPAAPAVPVPVQTVEVLNAWPHDPGAFTQGLVFHDGRLLESTGLYGESSLREVELETGRVLQSVPVSGEFFAEGLALFGPQLVQLTWREGRAFVYRREDFAPLGEFTYSGEGWGLTHDGTRLIMSDGTNRLRFLDPATFAVVQQLEVTDAGVPLTRLNELEWVRGEIWANVWQTDRIARIDPGTGQVLGYLDLTGLSIAARGSSARPVDVLNGIAYDAAGDRIFVTGKWWPLLMEIRPVAR